VPLGVIGAIAEAVQYGPEGQKYAKVKLQPLNPIEPGEALGEALALQYFPSEITEAHDIGWNFKDLPGGSHALAQWASNGGRTISMEVVASRFMKPVDDRNTWERLLDPFGANKPDSEYLHDNKPRNVDVAAVCRYLRSLKKPIVGTVGGQKVALSPPIVILSIPGFQLNDQYGSDAIFTVVTGCDITYKLAFPNGVLRLASVAMQFREVVQRPDIGAIDFAVRPPNWQPSSNEGIRFGLTSSLGADSVTTGY